MSRVAYPQGFGLTELPVEQRPTGGRNSLPGMEFVSEQSEPDSFQPNLTNAESSKRVDTLNAKQRPVKYL